MASAVQEKEWQERVAQWRASGLSQHAFALQHGFTQKQISNWSRRVAGAKPALDFVPVRVTTPTVAAQAINLRSAHGWILTLPRDVPATWLAEMLRAL